MSKYINADELKNKVMKEIEETEETEEIISNPTILDFVDISVVVGAKRVLRLLDEMPSADAVEVVRCRECKHSIHNVHSTSPNYKYFCEKTSANSHIEYHSENWFCADGERKDNNE